MNGAASTGGGEKSRVRGRVEAEEDDIEDDGCRQTRSIARRERERRKGNVPKKSKIDAKMGVATLAAVLLPLSPFAPGGQTSTKTCKSTVKE
jgi:hypothetical protein